jgi:hypothetical protein
LFAVTVGAETVGVGVTVGVNVMVGVRVRVGVKVGSGVDVDVGVAVSVGGGAVGVAGCRAGTPQASEATTKIVKNTSHRFI